MLVLVLEFCAFKFIMSNDCSAEGVPSVKLVRLPGVQFLSLEVRFMTWKHDLQLKWPRMATDV